MEYYIRYRETWFEMDFKDDGVYTRCYRFDTKRRLEELFFYGAENMIDLSNVSTLFPLTQIEKMLIARVHVFIEIR
jgi:hypothetical protein